jgi:hypothetical protein
VDFWDLTKLLVRRWAVALPMLLLSAAMCVYVVNQVRPNYIATAYVQLILPMPKFAEPGQAPPEHRNPWLEAGPEAIGNAARVTVMDQTVSDELKAVGYSESFTVEMESRSSMVSVEVVGASPHQARATADQLVGRFNESVAELQEGYGVPSSDLISSRRLDLGANVKESDASAKRALVAVAAAGILLTVLVTVAVDAWLRRRSRRRGAVESATPTSPAPGIGRATSTPAVDVADSARNDDDRTKPIREPSIGQVGSGTPIGVPGGGPEPRAKSSDRPFRRWRSGSADADGADQTARPGDVAAGGTVVLRGQER